MPDSCDGMTYLIYADEVICKEYHTVLFLRGRKNDQLRHGSWIYISRWSGDLCPASLLCTLSERGSYEGHTKLLQGKVVKNYGKEFTRGEIVLQFFTFKAELHSGTCLQSFSKQYTRAAICRARVGKSLMFLAVV